MNAFDPLLRSVLLAVAVAPGASPLGAADAASVFSSAGDAVIPLAGGLEPDRTGTRERLVVVTTAWTDLEQSAAGGAWRAAPAREIPWDQGGVVGAVSWQAIDYDPATDAGFALRAPSPEAAAARQVRFVNVSGRAGFRATNGSVITGFVFAGGPRRFLVRAAGPALAAFGVSEAMVDPVLTIHDGGGRPVAFSNDWDAGGDGDAIARATSDLGAFPFATGSSDAALLLDLTPGLYTVVVGSQAGDEGVTLAEAYAVPAEGQEGELLNLSLRARVEAGDRVAIPGFVTEGDSNRRYLVRVVGPGLIPFGVAQPLPDPRLTIHQGPEAVAANDNWDESLAAALVAEAAGTVGAFPLQHGSRDAAVLIALQPGPFTVVVEDATASGSSGEALIEVYLVPRQSP